MARVYTEPGRTWFASGSSLVQDVFNPCSGMSLAEFKYGIPVRSIGRPPPSEESDLALASQTATGVAAVVSKAVYLD